MLVYKPFAGCVFGWFLVVDDVTEDEKLRSARGA
jgi:hypothetical protein